MAWGHESEAKRRAAAKKAAATRRKRHEDNFLGKKHEHQPAHHKKAHAKKGHTHNPIKPAHRATVKKIHLHKEKRLKLATDIALLHAGLLQPGTLIK